MSRNSSPANSDRASYGIIVCTTYDVGIADAEVDFVLCVPPSMLACLEEICSRYRTSVLSHLFHLFESGLVWGHVDAVHGFCFLYFSWANSCGP